MARPADADVGAAVSPPGVREVYEAHGEFVWRSLARLGVHDSDLLDVSQEVFVVVHRRLASWNGDGQLTTWLFGICLRVAAAYRRRAFRRREMLGSPEGTVPVVDEAPTPEEHASSREGERALRDILDRLPLEQRAVFTMFEIDQLSCAEIAETLGCPVGTVHSRLHAARKAFELAAKRFRLREAAKPEGPST